MRKENICNFSITDPVGFLGKFPLILSVVVAGLACTIAKPGPLEWLGHEAPKGASPIGIVHKGGMLRFHNVEYLGVTYLIEVDTETEKVVAVEPRSKNFVTPEGIGFGDRLQEAISAGGNMDSQSCEVRLPSGWIAESSQIDPGIPCENQLGQPISKFSSYDQEWFDRIRTN